MGNDYIFAKGYTEHNNKVRYVHRIIMEQSLGRSLEFNEVVHHKNGDKKDNRLENLELVTRSNHSKTHAHRVKYIDIHCPECTKSFTLRPNIYRNRLKKGKGLIFCSRQCSGTYYGNRNYGRSV
jgi:hypothetical protein